MPGPGIADKTYLDLATPPHKAYDVEVAVAYTDKTWESVFMTVENKPIWLVSKYAEGQVLDQWANHPKEVSFARTIRVDLFDADGGEPVGDEEEIT